MALPTFLGIGAMRSGTTWLNYQLQKHPNVFIAKKEIHFFDRYYERGMEWYQNFFPEIKQTSDFVNSGEISPNYLFDPKVPQRINEHIPHCRFVIILRNPINRAFSQYTRALRNDHYDGSFLDYLEDEKDAFAKGLYYKQLKRYFDLFPKENFLILIFERVMSHPEKALEQIAHFLDIDSKGFDYEDINERVNASYLPRFPRLYTAGVRTRRFLQSRNLDFLLSLIKLLRIHKFVNPASARASLPKITLGEREQLYEKYREEIELLEQLINIDLSIWKMTEKSGGKNDENASHY